jgi:hypothetical protein
VPLVWLRRHPKAVEKLKVGWYAWAHSAGILLLAAVISYGLVMATVGKGEVWVGSNFELTSPEVPVNGDVTFRLTAVPNESCPGEVVTTFYNELQQPAAVVTQRRRLLRPGLEVRNQPFSVQLSPAVTAGYWSVEYAVDSRCPNRQKVDVLARFNIRVVH